MSERKDEPLLPPRVDDPFRYALFGSLHNRDFRWLWSGGLASSGVMAIESVARGWLVYSLTGSALALGWVASAQSIAQLVLSLFGGVICDRFDKRRLLLWGRGLQATNVAALGVLIALDAIQVWHVVVSSVVAGFLRAFLMPASKAYLAELVDRRTLLNAISLQSVGMGLTGIVGAALSGLLIDSLGVASAYGIITLLYLLAVLALTQTRSTGRRDGLGNSVLQDMWEGVRYVRSSPVLPTVLGLAFVRMGLGMSYSTLMPKFVEDVLGMGATALGVLSAAPNVGRLVGALILASMGDYRRKGGLLLGSGMLMAGALIAFINLRSFPAVALFVALVGLGHTACMVSNNALMQAHTEDRFRGRVSSMRQMMLGLGRLGTIPAGAAADAYGVPIVVTVQGLLFAVVFAGVALLRPKIRKLG